MSPSLSATLPLLLLLIKATAVLGLALVTALLLHRRSAGLRHVVWLTALAVVLMLPMLSRWLPVRLPVLPASTGWSAPLAQTGAAPLLPFDGVTQPPSLIPVYQPPVTTVPGHPTWALTTSQTLLLIWAGIALALLARLLLGMVSVRRVVHAAQSVPDDELLGTLYEIADRLGLERTPRLLLSDQITMPFATGFLTATIVLPETSTTWSRDQLTAVLIHELAHIRRRDLLGHTVGRVACALYWFHPMVWLAARRLRDASERACDDLAITLGTVPSRYAEHLLNLVTATPGDSAPGVAMALARRREFEGRMLAMLDPAVERRHPARWQAVSLGGTLALFMGGLAVAAPVAAVSHQAPAARQVTAAAPVVPASPVEPVAAAAPSPALVQSRQQAQASQRQADSAFGNDTLRRQRLHAARQRDLDQANLAVGAAATDLGSAASRFGLALVDDILNMIGLPGVDASIEPALLARVLLGDPDSIVRQTAAWGLEGEASDPAVLSALSSALLNDRDVRVRIMAAWALSSHHSEQVTPALRRGLTDPAPAVREMAAWALGTVGAQSAVRSLNDLLTTETTPAVHIAAAWALGTLRPGQAPAALGPLLRHRDPAVVTAAAWAVGEIRDRAMQSAVVEALHRPAEGRALEALLRAAHLVGISPGSAEHQRWLTDDNGALRQAAARMLTWQHWGAPWPWPWPRVMLPPSQP